MTRRASRAICDSSIVIKIFECRLQLVQISSAPLLVGLQVIAFRPLVPCVDEDQIVLSKRRFLPTRKTTPQFSSKRNGFRADTDAPKSSTARAVVPSYQHARYLREVAQAGRHLPPGFYILIQL